MQNLFLSPPRYLVDPLLPPAATRHCDVLVVGAGAAGLAAALRAAAQQQVIVLARGRLPESNSAWAQGGIAAALEDADSPRFHVDDTLIAGAGICDPAAVETLAEAAPALMHELAAMGVPFERENSDRFALGLEGGHSQRRILHVGDATGWAITRVLIERARRHPRIKLCEGYQAVDLLGDGICRGVLALDAQGNRQQFLADATILATGGAGALYGLTSNQPIALGEGIAMAFRAGAEVADMEFIQFHPTVMRTRSGQGFLISEATRGEGGRLFSIDGNRFMPAYDRRGELAPRDIVTRGIYAAMRRSHADHVLLDLTHLEHDYFARRFPTIYQRCLEEGIDPVTQPIPVAPAAHYLMGGIRSDLDGASSLPGLFVAGECACTGVHGANRLASNSLLECLVFGRRAGDSAIAGPLPPFVPLPLPNAAASVAGDAPGNWRDKLAAVMVAGAGPLRDAAGLRAALAALAQFPLRPTRPTADALTAANAALTAGLIVGAALLREESRGGHFRSDYNGSQADWACHVVQTRGQPPFSIESISGIVAEVVMGDG
jgi:L-aspartate oxidase